VGLFIGTEAELAASRKKSRSKGGKAFDKEFARQRAKGAKTFKFGGKSYSTALAAGGGKPAVAAVKKTSLAPKTAPTPTRRPEQTTTVVPTDKPSRPSPTGTGGTRTIVQTKELPSRAKPTYPQAPKNAPSPTGTGGTRTIAQPAAAPAKPLPSRAKPTYAQAPKEQPRPATNRGGGAAVAVVKPAGGATVAPKQQRLDAALAKAKQRSAQTDARVRAAQPKAAVAAVKTVNGVERGGYTRPKTTVFGNVPKPAPAQRQPLNVQPPKPALPSRAKPTYRQADKKRTLGIRRGGG